jgi:hypothetical protein
MTHGVKPSSLKPSQRWRDARDILGRRWLRAWTCSRRCSPRIAVTLAGRRRKRLDNLGVSVREYVELEAGVRTPNFETWDRTCKLYGWPRTFVNGGRRNA